MKKNLLFTILNLFSIVVLSQHITIYFTNPVNTSLSSGTNAVYLNNSMDDTLIAYINRSKYTLDIAVYNYQQTFSTMGNIANALNSAVLRGVVVRWIYDGSQSNSGMSALSPSVHTLASPTTTAYGIMHNKFMVIDANSSNVNDPIVWTGSTNWTATHFNSNVNNSIIIQDKNLALAYLTEFNEMWGSNGLSPNTTLSKFGPFKADNTPHIFTIDGKTIELYFSPTDGSKQKTLSAIQSANTELYFGMLSFSLQDIADSIISRKNKNVYTAGIIDQTSQFYTPSSSLTSSLGSNFKKYTQLTSVYHSKMLIVDANNVSSNPLVATGSYNWTDPASTLNDENLLIIHDATIANIFYQSFYQNFSDLGGTLSLPTAINEQNITMQNEGLIFPNPAQHKLHIMLPNDLNTIIKLYNSIGELTPMAQRAGNQSIELDMSTFAKGIYYIEIKFDEQIINEKIMIE